MGCRFDPDYASNGKFDTVLMEEARVAESALPDNTTFPGLNVVRMSLDPEVVTESYQHKLNRITKDHTDSRYRRFGSLLVHLRDNTATQAAWNHEAESVRTGSLS